MGNGGFGITENINIKILTDQWLNTFQVVKPISRGIFSDLYLVKMKSNAELRYLRKLKKIVFKG